jgi:putative endonuclease
LVYFECGGDIISAINREKQIKAKSRVNKEKLISSMNPDWKDLAEDWF